MRLCRPIIQRVSLGCFLLTSASGSSIADDGDKLASSVRTAWEKYSELQDVRAAYAGRSGHTLRSPFSRRVSVSSGVASTYKGRTCLPSRGNKPALIIDDFPQPEGP